MEKHFRKPIDVLCNSNRLLLMTAFVRKNIVFQFLINFCNNNRFGMTGARISEAGNREGDMFLLTPLHFIPFGPFGS
jgi:hypothetical protein